MKEYLVNFKSGTTSLNDYLKSSTTLLRVYWLLTTQERHRNTGSILHIEGFTSI